MRYVLLNGEIPLSNELYQYFNSEYKTLDRDAEGNIYMPSNSKKSSKKDIINSLKKFKDKILENEYVGINSSDNSYMFFLREYSGSFSHTNEYDFIIPTYDGKKLIRK